MSSSSPGHVNTGASYRDSTHNTPKDTRDAGHRPASTQRATAQKRARDSPSTPPRTRALELLGSITSSVRTGAVRGLRALTDTIERGRDDASSPSDSDPPSPTTALVARHKTPAGKRRRSVVSEARMRSSNAHWKGSQWDYSGAMADKVIDRFTDTTPSAFAFPQPGVALETQHAAESSMEATDAQVVTEYARPQSAMSTASAPAALTTPRSIRHAPAGQDLAVQPHVDQGWVMSFARSDDDPFAPPDRDMSASSDAGTETYRHTDELAQAVQVAASYLTRDAIQTPAACGALHDFQLRLRALDAQGNFTPQCPAGELAACEIRDLRQMVSELVTAQAETSAALRELLARDTHRHHEERATHAAPSEVEHPQPPPPAPDTSPVESARKTAPPSQPSNHPAPTPTPAPAAPRDTPPKEVGRHDERRAVFCPAVPFGGRIPTPVSPAAVRTLNNTSYEVRDAVNTALREWAETNMKDPANMVQVIGTNWTERGNLCAVVCDGFTSAKLLEHADVVANAAGIGKEYTANRDVPLFKAVLCNVPTKRADGSLFTEADVLSDLRAHSTAFDSLKLADCTESARWISTTGMRTQKPRSTLLLNFASEADAASFTAMHRRLFVFGCRCEPGEFQPRDKERICTRCWNPLARHRERDFACREKCRLCGGDHIEEEHTCTVCDVLAKPCAHVKLRCVNCGLEHSADDSVCEHRRRARGTSQSGPPMSERRVPQGPAKPAPKPKKRKGKTVRILEPHEPFPDDIPPHAPADRALHTPPAPKVPAPESGTTVSGSTSTGNPPSNRREQSQGAGTVEQRTTTPGAIGGQAPARTNAPVAAQEDEPMELDDAERAAICDLMGAERVREVFRTEPVRQSPSEAEGSAAPKRSASSRIAAAEAIREGRRRKAAHVLVRNFKFLSHPAAVDALKARLDDYASTVSWAADEQSKHSKPGMQGKSHESLRKIAEEMAKLSAADQPTTGVATTTASTTVNA